LLLVVFFVGMVAAMARVAELKEELLGAKVEWAYWSCYSGALQGMLSTADREGFSQRRKQDAAEIAAYIVGTGFRPEKYDAAEAARRWRPVATSQANPR
jgi:hypothetical protein